MRLLKMVKNQTVFNRSVIKFLVVEKCIPYQIYRRMFDVYGEVCFSQKRFTNRLIMSLQT